MEFDKSKIYTSVNADEVKIGSKGYVGDSIDELKRSVERNSVCCLEAIKPSNNAYRFFAANSEYLLFYLVEEPKEKTYRPYKDTDEMIEDFLERYNSHNGNVNLHNPLIWVKEKLVAGRSYTAAKYLIVSFEFLNIRVSKVPNSYTMGDLFEHFEYLDDTPCGKLEE